jgi:predicted nucleic acid-binding protein
VIYFDASAVITYLTQRPHFHALDEYLRTQPTVELATSTIGLVETVRICDRIGDFPHLLPQLLRDYTELRLTDDIRDRAATLPGGLRTLDAIHVATAEILVDDLTCLISYDKQMLEVANSRGLPIATPGMQT